MPLEGKGEERAKLTLSALGGDKHYVDPFSLVGGMSIDVGLWQKWLFKQDKMVNIWKVKGEIM